MGDIKWFLGLMGLFALLWVASGGVNGPNTKRPFVRPIIEGGGTYGEDFFPGTSENVKSNEETLSKPKPEPQIISDELDRAKKDAEAIQQELEDLKRYSVLHGKITLSRGSTAYENDPNSEQLIIYSNHESAVKLTGLVIKSTMTGRKVTIGTGDKLAIPGSSTGKETIYLPPNATAHISTGRSPIGTSFQLNTCTGYFEQNNDFSPNLSSDCPRLIDEPLPEAPNRLSDACLDYIETIYSCTIPELTPDDPAYFDRTCQSWIATEATYNQCVTRHKKDTDFYKNEWRIYLGQDRPLWKTSREHIELLDAEGKVVDEISY